MEVSGAPLYTCCSAAHPANSISQSKAMISWGVGNSKVSRFWDNSHLHYYCPTLRCCGKKQKPKNKNKSKLFSELGFGFHPACGLVDQVKSANMISGAEEALLVQLEQLRAQEKELKRMRKQVKAKLSSTRQLKDSGGVDCEAASSSSSSESSESSSDSEDCLEVVDTNRLRMEAAQSPAASRPLLLPLPISPNDQIAQKSEEKHYCTNGAASTSVSLTKKRIEVCMGNKCKKSGAEALLQEFDTRVGAEGTVVGCKCMGKCRDGPNVKVFDGSSSVPMAANNSLCIGVNLEDVGAILSNLVGEDQKVGGLVTA